MKAKNRMILFYQIILFFLLNIVLFYFVDFLIRKIPYLDIKAWVFETLLFILFWNIVVLCDIKLLLPFLKKKIKKPIQKYLLRNKKKRRLNKYLLGTLLATILMLFNLLNVDLIVQQYTTPLVACFYRWNGNNTTITNLDYSGIKSNKVEPEKIRNTSASSDYGRFLRTYRWKPFIEKAETVYGIEKGVLAGLIMQESFGNPLQLNSGNDGGAGLLMFQPGTGRAYGLKIYGNSSATGRDKMHGLALKALVELNEYNYEKLSQIDNRFHVAKSIDAGARFLSELHRKYHSWDKAISAYNRGNPAFVPQSTTHVRRVRHFQKQYLFYLRQISR